MKKELAKQYDPKIVEDKQYQFWTDQNYFHADPHSKKEPFTIVIPPPNITGVLHMGHALDNTLQDILIRWKKMQGYETLWQPGTDHAAISTVVKIVNKLAAKGITWAGKDSWNMHGLGVRSTVAPLLTNLRS
jgi:valyl-tRNA synthetase